MKSRFKQIIAFGPEIVIGGRNLTVDAVPPVLCRRADKTNDLF
jgi:hypothetical protein